MVDATVAIVGASAAVVGMTIDTTAKTGRPRAPQPARPGVFKLAFVTAERPGMLFRELVDDRLQPFELGIVERGQGIGRRIVDRIDRQNHLAACVGQ